MKLYSWNVNGIRAVWNKGKLQEFIAEHDPDILCLQEPKAMEDQSPIEGMDQYHQYWHSAQKKGYAGTVIFSKTEPISVARGFSEQINNRYEFMDSYGDTTNEGRVLTLEFDDFYVTTVYTPNSKGKLERLDMREKVWDPAYRDHLAELQDKKPVLACGDFNVAHNEIDLARPKENVRNHGFTIEERTGFTNILNEASMIDTFRAQHPDKADMYSYWSNWGKSRERNVGWRIDYWLASKSLADIITDTDIHMDVLGSDHCPVSITLS